MSVTGAIRYSKTTHVLDASEEDLQMVERVVSDSSKYEPDPFLRAFDDHMCYEAEEAPFVVPGTRNDDPSDYNVTVNNFTYGDRKSVV